MLRRTIFTLHLAAGLAGAAFLLVLGLTGSVMAFEPELDHLTHPHLFRVAPQGAPLPLADLAARAAPALTGPIVGYRFGASPDLSYSIETAAGAVFVNQYTGDVLGIRDGPTWFDTIHQLHLRLLVGAAGKTVMAWAGVVLVVLSLSGLYLWWPIKRISVNAAATGRRFWFDLHNAIGAVSFACLLLLALTGSIIGFERITTPAFYSLTGSQPYARTVPVSPNPAARRITPDEALTVAARQLPGAAPIELRLPDDATSYRVGLRYPEDLTPGGRSRVFVNPHGGAVLLVESSRTTAAGTRLVNLNRAIHTGDLFGVPTKAVMSLASLALVAQVGTGLAMWWTRMRRRRGRAVRIPEARVA